MRDIHQEAHGRWKGLLLECGVPEAAKIVSGKHMPCPMCGGKDRFRYSDFRGRGDYFCNSCGHGTGLDLVMKLQDKSFIEATDMVRQMLHLAPIEVPKAVSRDTSQNYIDQLWRSSDKLTGDDPASLYLRRRGMNIEGVLEIRCAEKVKYADKETPASYHWAMVARYLSPDNEGKTVHLTYLNEDGSKANVPKPKKLAPGSVPKGGAVRLSRSAETLGIAEGIETALSAHAVFDVPVWAALNAGAMMKWEPPQHVKCVIVFGDNDANFTGQSAAYALAHRLSVEGRHVEVRIPDDVDTDWNDVLQADGNGNVVRLVA